jgi:hypothetical protein
MTNSYTDQLLKRTNGTADIPTDPGWYTVSARFASDGVNLSTGFYMSIFVTGYTAKGKNVYYLKQGPGKSEHLATGVEAMQTWLTNAGLELFTFQQHHQWIKVDFNQYAPTGCIDNSTAFEITDQIPECLRQDGYLWVAGLGRGFLLCQWTVREVECEGGKLAKYGQFADTGLAFLGQYKFVGYIMPVSAPQRPGTTAMDWTDD